jgi:chromosome segregation ATPase
VSSQTPQELLKENQELAREVARLEGWCVDLEARLERTESGQLERQLDEALVQAKSYRHQLEQARADHKRELETHVKACRVKMDVERGRIMQEALAFVRAACGTEVKP